jgi:uncharacterized membrane protein YoaK (UPF0700 family)
MRRDLAGRSLMSTAPADVTATFDQEAARSIRHPLTRGLLVLTFSTGLVDAVSYLGLGHVFTANMTGNAILLGFGVAGSGGLPIVGPVVSLGAFLTGAGVGGILAARRGDRHSLHIADALLVEVCLLGTATVLAAAAEVRSSAGARDVVVALLALAMGVRNATVRRIGVPDLTTTVLTMTLTGLAADSRPAGGTGAGSIRRLAAVLAMLAGALGGALLVETSLVLPLAAAAGLALVTRLAYVPYARRREQAGGQAAASAGM